MVLPPEPGQTREIQVRVVCQDGGCPGTGRLLHLGRQDHGAGQAGVQLGTITSMTEKTDVILSSGMQRRQTPHLLRGRTLQLPAKGADNKSQAQRHSSRFSRGSLGRVKRLDDLLGDVVFGIDVDSILQDHIVFF